ncbi:MAG: DUF3842 family protein [Planctomycetes bacterium]|nr:DUF3842 family protein [Planctomycetota bacterium]
MTQAAKPLVAVIDGQGGGVGKALVERLRATHGGRLRLLALGANSLATAQMLKAGADEGATGENAVVMNAPRADMIMGAVGIIAADAMLGEITAAMAAAVARSPAVKILLPLNRCSLRVAGLADMSFSAYIDRAVADLTELLPGLAAAPEA